MDITRFKEIFTIGIELNSKDHLCSAILARKSSEEASEEVRIYCNNFNSANAAFNSCVCCKTRQQNGCFIFIEEGCVVIENIYKRLLNRISYQI